MIKVGTMIQTTLLIVFSMVFMTVVFVCIMTPEKTKDGVYTSPYKYWTSDTYYCENFVDNSEYCKQLNK